MAQTSVNRIQTVWRFRSECERTGQRSFDDAVTWQLYLSWGWQGIIMCDAVQCPAA